MVILIRNWLYDLGLKKSTSFQLPIISIGNLSVGGTGKTPHIEFLIRELLLHDKKIATLSRGYKRKTTGFLTANENTSSEEVGDEPKQMHNKFKEVVVAVDEKRVHGIEMLKKKYADLEVILLDDAFQHRALVPGLSILLTDYNHPFFKDHLLPTGNLREHRKGKERADIIVVSKSPKDITDDEMRSIVETIRPSKAQSIYFSGIEYGRIYGLLDSSHHYKLSETSKVYLFTGIANSQLLESHIHSKTKNVVALKFPDHHHFSRKDLASLSSQFARDTSKDKVILTTEKDAVRLSDYKDELKNLPIYVISITVRFKNENEFRTHILDFLKSYDN